MDATENSLYVSILITVVVIGIVIGIFVFSIIRNQKKTISLQRANTLAEITIQEKERARIASDIHDELGPRISIVKMNMNSFILTDPDDLLQLEKTNENLNEISRRIREISFNLMPGILLNKGLLAALEQYSNNIRNPNLKIKLNTELETIILDQAIAINIYRIIQEIIQNTVKHAEATLLQIFFTKNTNKLSIKSFDNGKGFAFETGYASSEGQGLKNIVRRVEFMGSNLFVESKINVGTSYHFEISI